MTGSYLRGKNGLAFIFSHFFFLKPDIIIILDGYEKVFINKQTWNNRTFKSLKVLERKISK